MSKTEKHRFIGGVVILMNDQLIAKAREGLKAHPECDRQAEVVFLLDEVVYTCDFETFTNFIRTTSKRDW